MADDDSKPAIGFVPLKAITQGAPDPPAVLAEIRQIYFRTSKKTIEHDFAHAIELLRRLPDEETRQKAHVYMEGLAEMRNEWMRPAREKPARGTPQAGRKAGTGSPAPPAPGRRKPGKPGR
jgi:hypothetical protein